jgi:methionyl-tRNA formyltransferase
MSMLRVAFAGTPEFAVPALARAGGFAHRWSAY